MGGRIRMRRRRALLTLLGGLAAAALLTPSARASTPSLSFRGFAATGLRLTDIAWTGHHFLLVNNTTNVVSATGPAGTPLTQFAAMPRQVEETRCSVSTGSHGFTPGDIYCHSPDNKIYRISASGKRISVLAALPHSQRSDGALNFDTVGSFGFALLAATGRSGTSKAAGGALFAISPSGKVRLVGSYPGPGGADEVAVAPAGFGSVGGQALLTVDAGHSGRLLAMNAQGLTRTLLRLPDGPNPIAVLRLGSTPPAGAAQVGLYVTDTRSHTVFLAPGAELAAYSGDVLVGSELRGIIWIVRPRGHGFTALKLPTNLSSPRYNLEAAVFVAG